VQPRARREHPAGEDALDLALQGDLVDLHECVRIRRLGRRARIAGARGHLQGAELHGLADRDVEIDDAAGDLVETGEQRAGIGDLLRRRLGDGLVARRRSISRRRRAARRRGALAGRQARRIGPRGRRRQRLDCTAPGGGARPLAGGGEYGGG